MDNKHKAAELVLEFLSIVGQDSYTGIETGKKCAKIAAKLLMKAHQEEDIYDYDEIIKLIDTF